VNAAMIVQAAIRAAHQALKSRTAPTEAWLKQVKAPSKQAVWFERSAHMVPWEEPGKTLVSLLTYVRPLAQ
jgi:hypothetical protein